MINESSLRSTAQAQQYGQGIMAKYGGPNCFATIESGLEAGQLLRVVKPLFDIDDNFLIESVDVAAYGPDEIEYQVSALDGASIGGWEQFFQKYYQYRTKLQHFRG